jgi:hypothetical protein
MTKRRRVEPISFRVYPENKSLYFVINVWPSRRAMHRHSPEFKSQSEPESIVALCTIYERHKLRDGRWHKRPECGRVNFYRQALGVGVVAHEFMHAAFGWARRVGLNTNAIFDKTDKAVNVHADEERLCHAHQEMVRQFVERAYTLGLYA